MTRCSRNPRIQDYLDGEMAPAERLDFEGHVRGCAECGLELAAYRRVFERLETLETWEPSPDFADRVLGEVMPRHPARWLRPFAWGAGLTAAASLALIGAAVFVPGPRAWMNGLVAEAARAVVSSLVFVLKSFNGGALRALESLSRSGTVLARAGALLRALVASASHPAVAFTLWAALLAGVALLWWMRPREDRSAREDQHVGMLGL
jgi:hypothetical protein